MVFETDPIVIELFPLLVTIPAAVTFLVAMVTKHWSSEAEHRTFPITSTHLERGTQLTVGILFVATAMTGVVAIAFNSDAAFQGSFFFLTALHMVFSAFIGVFAGRLLALLYSTLGVSAFAIAALLMSAIPLTAVTLGVVGTSVGFVLNMMIPVAIVSLFRDACQRRGIELALGKVEPSKQTVSQAVSHVAAAYVLVAVGILLEREERDNDIVAQEALERVLQTGGRTGNFIRETIRRGTPSNQVAVEPQRGPGLREITHFMPQGNWTLTNSRFRRRVQLNRLLFLGVAVCLAVLGLNFSSNLSTSTNQWAAVLLFGVLGLSLLLAFLDPFFRGNRPNTERTVSMVLATFRGAEDYLSLESDDSTQSYTYSSEAALAGGQERQAGTVLSPDFIERQERSLRSFLIVVADGKNEVYEESTRPAYVAAAGAVIGLPMAAATAFTIQHYIPVFHEILIALACAGIALMIPGFFRWYSLMKRTSFRGCRRTWMSIALSYLDAKESGVVDIGWFVPFPSPPKQFAFLKWAGPDASWGFLRGMRPAASRDPQREQILSRGLLFMSSILLVALVVALLIIRSTLLVVLFLAVFVILLGSLLNISIKGRRTKPEAPIVTSAGPPENVVQVLRLLKSEYAYPLRLLTVRKHAELMYTGRTFLTTMDIRFREAVFIPVVKSQPQKQST